MKDQSSFNRPMITPILELVCVDQLNRFKWKLFQLSKKKKSRFLHKQALKPIAASNFWVVDNYGPTRETTLCISHILHL